MRNHDEWSLDKLSDAERQEVFTAFGPQADMQLFGRGLRRRLPTMLDGDQARIRMVYSLMFALPGAPVLFYGEEIGMAENLAIQGRKSVRSPMQWSDEANGGFSTARRSSSAARSWQASYGPAAINVADQRGDRELAAELDGAADPPAQGMPGDRLGRVRSWTPAPSVLRCATTGRPDATLHNLSGKRCRRRLAPERRELGGPGDLRATATTSCGATDR